MKFRSTFDPWLISREKSSCNSAVCSKIEQSGVLFIPAKTNLQDHARILQESCMQVLLGTCTQYVPFLARFLHNLAHILQEMVQDFARVAARIITCISCTFFARIGARLFKNRARKGTYRMQVLHARFLQDSCMMLASSFLLGWHINLVFKKLSTQPEPLFSKHVGVL